MPNQTPLNLALPLSPAPQSSIIDNRDGNTLLASLQAVTDSGRELCIASAFFTLDALLLLADTLGDYAKIRLLFGDDANPGERRKLLDRARRASEVDLLVQREAGPALLSPLQTVERLFREGRIEARCYTRQKFHAKAYLIRRDAAFAPRQGILGSGNFTRSGLTRNIELNVHLTIEQSAQLEAWFDDRWAEADKDVVTPDILSLLTSQIALYHPYALFQKALSVWGDFHGGTQEATSLPLDPHQAQGFGQALNILAREQGVLVCDGVGLGKSFIGLALMEHFCRQGRNVLLVAPKNILDSSWKGYLDQYLRRYRSPFGNITEMSMTEFGYAPDDPKDGPPAPADLREKRDKRDALWERADVLVIDEAHNFRTPSASRYQNLFKIVQQARSERKKVILLTATPINTEYADLSAQVALITQDKGRVGGYDIGQIRRSAVTLDRELRQRRKAEEIPPAGQLSLSLRETDSQVLNKVLEAVLIQRSRKTCKALAAAAGKDLRFPHRNPPQTVSYDLGGDAGDFREMIAVAERRFTPGVALNKKMAEEAREADAKDRPPRPVAESKKKLPGIKLAAFLLEQYRYEVVGGSKRYQDEVRLAGLVYSNALKQLESSPPAFQGILQSLGEGLIARLEHVFKEEARPLIEPHLDWVRTPLFPRAPEAAEGDDEADDDVKAAEGEALDRFGADADEWLAQAVQERQLSRKLAGFTDDKYDRARWRRDILADLSYLQEIHEATLKARLRPDPKLARVLPLLKDQVAQGRRVLVFTQSRRTAEYLERELKIPGAAVARVDSRVEDTRAALLHAFCPGYNPCPPGPRPPSVPARVDVLVSTDVLSEGVNLQEAGAILNYDIHWNPVRLIQRIGRVDRRLDPVITPEDHSFDIFNVLPPPEIDGILQLVGVVENRTLRISRTLGLDASFFKSTDPAGNLKEFNARYEGEMTGADRALADWLRQRSQPDPELAEVLKTLPPGAFGVWKGAPSDGLFALWTLQWARKEEDTPQADRDRWGTEIGRPLLALARPGLPPLLSAGEIFDLLRGTVKGRPSGTPSDEKELGERLKALKNAVRQQFSEVGLPKTVLPRLVCWMEWKKG